MIFKPHIRHNAIAEITLEDLRRFNVKALMLDVDNTMSTHDGQVLTNGLTEWLAMLRNNGIKLLILSNAKKERVEPFAAKIGLEFIHLAAKPLPFGYWRAVRKLGTSCKNTAIVGDQLFTDMLGGFLSGTKKILLTPIEPEDKPSFIIRRKIEKLFLKRYKF